MSNLKRRIKTVKNTSKLTKAMSLISAAQMNKIKHKLFSHQHYYQVMNQIISTIAFQTRTILDHTSQKATISNQFVVNSCYQSMIDIATTSNKTLIIIITGEKGLCGSFNSAVINKLYTIINDSTDILCLGKKGFDILRRSKCNSSILNHFIELHCKNVHEQFIMSHVTQPILKLFSAYSEIKIIYTKFISMLRQEVIVKDLLPLTLEDCQNEIIEFDGNPVDMLYNIIPQYIHTILYSSILNSMKSETVKRMMTMDNAHKNSQDMLKKLTLSYNRTRQTKVTMELIEVISGTIQ